jgi:uncharacterized membrane protein
MNDRIHTQKLSLSLLLGLILTLLAVSVALAAGNIDPTHKWAWSTNTGWLNFAPDNGGVTVYSDHLEGYAWGENIGWIRLGTCAGGSPCTHANTSATDYGVNNDGVGHLSGYAWGTNVGWINFAPANGGVTIDPLTGDFDGYAWGENVGWIHFQNASPAYKVNTTWRSSSPPVGNIDPTHKWAWSTNTGWLNFAPDNGGVTVYSDHLEGYAWGENIGWIRLGTCAGGSPCTHANTSATDYGVNNDGVGHLSGYAWGTNVGWINFAPANGGVTIDPLTGDFDGYAWGENVGWIHFQNASPAYRVTTSWRGNRPPVADAGPDQTVNTLALVTLDGSGSSDPDGDYPLAYLWTQTGGPAVTLSDPAVVTPTFSAPADPAVLTFTLVVTDSLGLVSAPDEVVITVQPYRVYLPLVIRPAIENRQRPAGAHRPPVAAHQKVAAQPCVEPTPTLALSTIAPGPQRSQWFRRVLPVGGWARLTPTVGRKTPNNENRR